MQHNATHCNTLQHTTTYCNTENFRLVEIYLCQGAHAHPYDSRHGTSWSNTLAPHCTTLQHTATQRVWEPCSSMSFSKRHFLQRYARNTLQHTATRCNTQQHTATQRVWEPCSSMSFSTGCFSQQYARNTLQHIATNCNTLQHAATQRVCEPCSSMSFSTRHFLQRYARAPCTHRRCFGFCGACMPSPCTSRHHFVLFNDEPSFLPRRGFRCWCLVCVCVCVCCVFGCWLSALVSQPTSSQSSKSIVGRTSSVVVNLVVKSSNWLWKGAEGVW